MIDVGLLEQMHATFCETVARLRDETAPMIVVVKPEEMFALVVLGDSDEIVRTLVALACDDDFVDPEITDDVIGLIVHTIAWSAPASLGGSPRALGEAGDPRVRSIAQTIVCTADNEIEMTLAGRSTEYDPVTGELGEIDAPEIEPGGRISLALAAATRLLIAKQATR